MSSPDLSRQQALDLPHTEPLLNGRCVGQMSFDPNYGTVLTVIYCEHPGGRHIPWPDTGWNL